MISAHFTAKVNTAVIDYNVSKFTLQNRMLVVENGIIIEPLSTRTRLLCYKSLFILVILNTCSTQIVKKAPFRMILICEHN